MLASVFTPCSPASTSAEWPAMPCTARAHRPALSPCRLPRTPPKSAMPHDWPRVWLQYCSLMQVSWPRPACTHTRAPPSPPCPVASLTRGIVVRVPSKSFSAARKNRRLQRPLTPLVRTLWLLPAHAAAQQRLPACRVHRPERPLTLHRPRTVDSNGRRCPALAPAPCTSAIDLGVRRS